MEYIHTLKMNAIAPSGTQVSGPLNYSNVFKWSKHHTLFNVKTKCSFAHNVYDVLFLLGNSHGLLLFFFFFSFFIIISCFFMKSQLDKLSFYQPLALAHLPMCFAIFMNSSPDNVFWLIFFAYFGLFSILIFTYIILYIYIYISHGAHQKLA